MIDGSTILPDGWTETAGQPQKLKSGETIDYGYRWWPGWTEPSIADKAFAAIGDHTRAEEYLLSRALLLRARTGEVVDEDWLTFSFPPQWHYDVLRALEYLRRAGADEVVELPAHALGHGLDHGLQV